MASNTETTHVLLNNRPSLRKMAGALWDFRAHAEVIAQARFLEMHHRLIQAKASSVVISLTLQAADDEARHALLCQEAAALFGVSVDLSRSPHVPPLGPDGGSHRFRALYAAVALSCITESLSAALLGEMSRQTKGGPLYETVHQILKDEIQHGRVGWAYLGEGHPDTDLVAIGKALPEMLTDTIGDALVSTQDDNDNARDLMNIGALPQNLRREIFLNTMKWVIFPGLEKAGVPTAQGEQWVERIVLA